MQDLPFQGENIYFDCQQLTCWLPLEEGKAYLMQRLHRSVISQTTYTCASQIYPVFTSNWLEGYLNWAMGTSPLYLTALLTQMTKWKCADRKQYINKNIDKTRHYDHTGDMRYINFPLNMLIMTRCVTLKEIRQFE